MRMIIGSRKEILNNEKGIALVTALVLGLVGMLMIASLLTMVGTGVWVSGSQKAYQMALDAAYGGLNLFSKEVVRKGAEGTLLSTMGNYGGIFAPIISDANFITKLTTTGRVDDGVYPNIRVDARVEFKVPSGPTLTVNSGIISTSRGNSGSSQNLLQTGSVVNSGGSNFTPQHIPYLFQTDINASNLSRARENASLSSLYLY